MANIRDVARIAGVSVTTASRALSGNGRVSSDTIIRVRAAVDETGFVPSEVARGLLTGRTQTLGIVVPDITNPFFSGLMASVERAAKVNGRTVFLTEADAGEDARDGLARLRARGVDGLILVGNLFRDAATLQHAAQDTPLVIINRVASSVVFSTVSSDHADGSRRAVDHLVALGHRRVAHFAGPGGVDVPELRASIFLAEAAAAGIEAVTIPSGFTIRDGANAAERFLMLSDRPTAVFAANDFSAFGAIDVFRRAGRSVPEDIAVIGYDDIPMAPLFAPGLTTIRQDTDALGAAAVIELERQLDGGRGRRTITTPVALIVRGTTRRTMEEA